MTTNEFAAQWVIDELPACPVGLQLLQRFAETAPGLYAVAQRAQFRDVRNANVAANRFWRAFEDHYTDCGDCNEA